MTECPFCRHKGKHHRQCAYADLHLSDEDMDALKARHLREKENHGKIVQKANEEGLLIKQVPGNTNKF